MLYLRTVHELCAQSVFWNVVSDTEAITEGRLVLQLERARANRPGRPGKTQVRTVYRGIVKILEEDPSEHMDTALAGFHVHVAGRAVFVGDKILVTCTQSRHGRARHLRLRAVVRVGTERLGVGQRARDVIRQLDLGGKARDPVVLRKIVVRAIDHHAADADLIIVATRRDERDATAGNIITFFKQDIGVRLTAIPAARMRRRGQRADAEQTQNSRLLEIHCRLSPHLLAKTDLQCSRVVADDNLATSPPNRGALPQFLRKDSSAHVRWMQSWVIFPP